MKVAIIGDGGWGTALAVMLAAKSTPVSLWSHDESYAEEMSRTRLNRKFLADIPLDPAILITSDEDEAACDAAFVVVAVPTIYLREVLPRFKGRLPGNAPIVSVTKGIEQKTHLRPSQIVREHFGDHRLAVLSGPSHAEEVARELPTTVVCASEEDDVTWRVQKALHTTGFRIYVSSDVIGVELGGALKNVIAIAAGVCEGLDFGDNSKSALMTRGLAEMTRLGVALGADAATFRGLSGMGDLITTCVSPFGRNRRVGLEIAKGKTIEEINEGMEMVAEGVHTTRAVVELAEQLGIDVPISQEVFNVLFECKGPEVAVIDLMTRAARTEKEDFEHG